MGRVFWYAHALAERGFLVIVLEHKGEGGYRFSGQAMSPGAVFGYLDAESQEFGHRALNHEVMTRFEHPVLLLSS